MTASGVQGLPNLLQVQIGTGTTITTGFFQDKTWSCCRRPR
jgi:hypothetical protein